MSRLGNAFVSILTTTPVLTIFNPDPPTELHTNASAEGYGAILFQKNINELHVVEEVAVFLVSFRVIQLLIASNNTSKEKKQNLKWITMFEAQIF